MDGFQAPQVGVTMVSFSTILPMSIGPPVVDFDLTIPEFTMSDLSLIVRCHILTVYSQYDILLIMFSWNLNMIINDVQLEFQLVEEVSKTAITCPLVPTTEVGNITISCDLSVLEGGLTFFMRTVVGCLFTLRGASSIICFFCLTCQGSWRYVTNWSSLGKVHHNSWPCPSKN